MKILVDAMGGDNAPLEIIKGAYEAAGEVNATIVLIGNQGIILKSLKELGEMPQNIEIKSANEVILNEDIPTKAIKSKKDSSMVVGLNMLREKEGSVFISAGNTGALLTGALLNVGRIKGVARPALCPILPSMKKPFILADGGANANCKPDYLVQFAKMGALYYERNFNIRKPRVGLVNVGTESGKGNDLTKATFPLLQKDEDLNFVGNVEGRDLMLGNVDVAVCDGFTGNVILKTLEGFGVAVFGILKESIEKSIVRKTGALLMKPALRDIKHKMDYTEYGGAILLGIDGGVIKCHGTSKAREIKNAIKQAYDFEKGDMIESIKSIIK